MSKFNISTTISLAHLGDAHTDDYLKFTPLTFKDARELEAIGKDADGEESTASVEAAIDLIKSKFLKGMITNEETGEPVEVTVDDFDTELGIELISHVMRELGGQKSEGFTQA